MSKSLETARMAMPVLVCLMNITSEMTSRIVSTGVSRVIILIFSEPTAKLFFRKGISGYGLARPPVI